MHQTSRRIAVLAAAVLTATLAACTNPTAPSNRVTKTADQANFETGYQGSVGDKPIGTGR